MFKFYLPYKYGFDTRAKGFFYKLSFILYIFLPNVLPIFLIKNVVNFKIILDSFIAFTVMYCVYEIGYLQNDVITVMQETNPTYRLKKEEREYVKKHYLTLISARIIYIFILIYFLWKNKYVGFNYFIISIFILYIGYSFYNSYRNRYNLISLFFVLIGKYCAVPLLFLPIKDYYHIILAILFAIPIYRVIEEAYTGKIYTLKCKLFSSKNIDLTRMLYYLILLSISVLMYVCLDSEYIYEILIYSYLFIFRMICYIASKNKKIIANRKKCAKEE